MVGYGFMGKAHSNAWRQAPHFFPLKAKVEMSTICGRDRARVVLIVGCRRGADRQGDGDEQRLSRHESDGERHALQSGPGAREDHQHRCQGERARRRHEGEEQDAQNEIPSRAGCLATGHARTEPRRHASRRRSDTAGRWHGDTAIGWCATTRRLTVGALVPLPESG